MIYLASPYTHPQKKVMTRRYLQVKKYAVELMKQGHCVFSPILYGHPIKANLPKDFDWIDFDLNILKECDCLLVLCLPGWDESKGISEEFNEAAIRKIQVWYAHWKNGKVVETSTCPPKTKGE